MGKASEIIKNKKSLEKLLNLMNEANKAIMKVYEKSNSEFILKTNNTPVTEADWRQIKF